MKVFSIVTTGIAAALTAVHFAQKFTSGFTYVPTAGDAGILLGLGVWAALMYIAEKR